MRDPNEKVDGYTVAEYVETYADVARGWAGYATQLEGHLQSRAETAHDRELFRTYAENSAHFLGQAQRIALDDPENADVKESLRTAQEAVDSAKEIAARHVS
jgi:hypothetical protein